MKKKPSTYSRLQSGGLTITSIVLLRMKLSDFAPGFFCCMMASVQPLKNSPNRIQKRATFSHSKKLSCITNQRIAYAIF